MNNQESTSKCCPLYDGTNVTKDIVMFIFLRSCRVNFQKCLKVFMQSLGLFHSVRYGGRHIPRKGNCRSDYG